MPMNSFRIPTPYDIKRTAKLHKVVHGVSGMFGSLDCTHTYWKNCAKGWAGSYSGKEHKPSIVLEAIVDHHTFFWHASYGYAGRMNDINIFNVSPFKDNLMNGVFDYREDLSGVVPYKICDEEFSKMFILVDGIYPSYSRFVKAIKQPITRQEVRFAAWQESARKDVERAFGILKSQWKFVEHRIYLLDLSKISLRMNRCLILHNVLDTNRVMGSCELLYDPAYSIEVEEEIAVEDQNIDEGMDESVNYNEFWLSNERIMKVLTRDERWSMFNDKEEYKRLIQALMNRFE